jgi:hypothetical protein
MRITKIFQRRKLFYSSLKTEVVATKFFISRIRKVISVSRSENDFSIQTAIELIAALGKLKHCPTTYEELYGGVKIRLLRICFRPDNSLDYKRSVGSGQYLDGRPPGNPTGCLIAL